MYNTWWCVASFPGTRTARDRGRAAPYDLQAGRSAGRVQARLSHADGAVIALRLALRLIFGRRVGPARVGEKVLRELGKLESRRRLVVGIAVFAHIDALDHGRVGGEAIRCGKGRQRRVAAHLRARRMGHGSHDAADGAGDRDARLSAWWAILVGCYSKGRGSKMLLRVKERRCCCWRPQSLPYVCRFRSCCCVAAAHCVAPKYAGLYRVRCSVSKSPETRHASQKAWRMLVLWETSSLDVSESEGGKLDVDRGNDARQTLNFHACGMLFVGGTVWYIELL